jgi:hypothetical protein
MPAKMAELWTALGSGRPLPNLAELDGLDATGWSAARPEPLFPRPESGA